MKKRIKVFESGEYPQGNIDKEQVKNIFSKAERVDGIFQHSSKWKAAGKNPVKVGNFENFGIEETEEKAVVYADINFNDKGKSYYEDDILKGVSVEITNGNLDKIAVLPVGVNPAIKGAEFEEHVIEFEEIEDRKGNDMTREEVLKSLTKEEILTYGKIEGLEIKEVVPEKQKTEEEIRAAIEAEYEQKTQAKTKALEFMEANKLKITPAMKENGLNEEMLTKVFQTSETMEFGNENITLGALLTKIFEKMPRILDLEQVYRNVEFEQQGAGENVTEIMKKAKEETEKMYK